MTLTLMTTATVSGATVVRNLKDILKLLDSSVGVCSPGDRACYFRLEGGQHEARVEQSVPEGVPGALGGECPGWREVRATLSTKPYV